VDDCHKSKELRSGAPLNELAAVRDLFFPNPGPRWRTQEAGAVAGSGVRPGEPTDAQFVENVMWEESQSSS